jgi:LEA14-like dessication related protein
MKTLLSISVIAAIIFSSCTGKNVKEPEYRDIRNIRLINLGPLQSTAGVDLVYYNPNGFGVQVETATGDIYVDSSFFGRFELSDKVQVKKKSEFTLPALVKIDMISAIKNERDIFKKKEALVRIEGMATVKKAGFSRDVPIKLEQMQDIEKFKKLLSN